MSKELEKFVKDLSSLENYCVLAVHKDEVILGTLLNFTEVKKIGGGAYSFHGIIEKQEEKTWPVYFIVRFKENGGLSNMFSCPVFYWSKEKAAQKNAKELKQSLEDFLDSNF